MANRVFQSVIYQMKDAINRVVGVVDETGAVISCSELNLIGEVRDGFVAERLTAGDRFVRDGYTYQQFSSAKHNDYAVFVEGADETAGQFAAVLSISLQSISSSIMRRYLRRRDVLVRMRMPFFGLVVQAASILPVSRSSTMHMRHAP